MKKSEWIKAVSFFLLCALMLTAASLVVGKRDDRFGYQLVRGLYEEEPGALDAVYIGGSNVFMFWNAPLAFGHYGITVWPFSSDAQNFSAAEYLIREARKTQPDALYIVAINTINSGKAFQWIHALVDYMPPSYNKHQIIERWADLAGIDKNDRAEFYFPLLRFHSRWSELTARDFTFSMNGMKSGVVDRLNLERIQKQDGEISITEKRGPLSSAEQEIVDSLLDYCDAEKVNVLFLISARNETEANRARINTACDRIREHGYPILDMAALIDEIGLDPATDYYNAGHTNIHGSVKITDYLAQYLVDTYGFSDKRGDPGFADWDAAYDNYGNAIAPYTLPFEYNGAKRDYSLMAPKVSKVKETGEVHWEKVDGASGYGVFRKAPNEAWELLDVVDGQQLEWKIPKKDQDKEYAYTIAPYRLRDGEQLWGKYDIASANRSSG